MLAPPLNITPASQEAMEHAMRNVWRASELAVSRASTIATGHPILDGELPNGGWPRSALVELLVQQHGIGEMQLLKPVLASLSGKQAIALIQPPYLPHAMACRSWSINDRNLLWIRPQSSADALWAAEQVLKFGICSAVILWQTNVRPEALRRLNLAAQSTDTWLWLVRPMAAATDASPSPLRIALRPQAGGISANIIKRKGPHCESPIFIPLVDMPVGRQLLDKDHETPARRVHTAVAVGSTTPVLV